MTRTALQKHREMMEEFDGLMVALDGAMRFRSVVVTAEDLVEANKDVSGAINDLKSHINKHIATVLREVGDEKMDMPLSGSQANSLGYNKAKQELLDLANQIEKYE